MAYSPTERTMREGAYGVASGLLVAATIQAGLPHPYGFYRWQVEFIGTELAAAVLIATALFLSRRG